MTADARVVDGGGAADARQVDAGAAIDARPPVDAPPVIDARPPVDAAPPVDAGPIPDAAPIVPDAFVPLCTSDAVCAGGAGPVCAGPDTTANCVEQTGFPGCFKVAAPTECPGSTICTGAGLCTCPTTATGNVVGGVCSTAQAQTCSDDGNAVLTCASDAQACLVWTVATPSADQCNLPDGTGDGLTCAANQCVCPDNSLNSIKYANPSVDRDARPGLVRNGRRFPAICSFDTMTLALEAAANPMFALTGIAVAANDDPEFPGTPAVFDAETFPWHIPTGRIMTTTDDPVSGVGGNGQWAPQNFIVQVNNDTASDGEDASVVVDGTNNRTGRGGSLRGLTFVEGDCDGDTCGLPNSAIQVLNHGAPANTFNALNFVVVDGGGGSAATQPLSGAITATVSGDSVTLSIAGNTNAFTGLDEANDHYVLVAGGPDADPALVGLFLVDEFVDGDTVTVRNPDATAGDTFTGVITVVGDHDWNNGVLVTNSNATLNQLVVRNFGTFGAGSRSAILAQSDFPGSPAQGVFADVIAINGGRYALNDVAIVVDGPDDNELNVAIGPSGATPTTLDHQLSVGLVAQDGTVSAASLIATNTYSDGAGIGILVEGSDVSTSGVVATLNATHGLAYTAGTLIDTGSSFTSNSVDGVNISNGVVDAKPQAESDVELNNSTITGNTRFGLSIEGDGLSVTVLGGTISSNVENGIDVSGNSTLTTGSTLEVDSNALNGIHATDGLLELNATNVNLNGTANLCATPGEDLAANAVVIEGNATMHATAIDVSNNRGGGIDIGTPGSGGPNTVTNSTITNNQSVDTCGAGETNPASGPGVLVRASSVLSFATLQSVISGNAGVGVYVAGTASNTGAGAPILIQSNAWTGLFVAASGSVVHTAGVVSSNGTAPQGTGFNDGAHIEGAYDSTNVEYASNAGDGLIVNIADTDVAALTFPTIRSNGANGVNVLGASGSGAALIDSLDAVSDAQYGFVIRTNLGSAQDVQIFNNVGDGIRLGDATQPNDILAKIGDSSIHNNGGVGIRVRQSGAQGPRELCTESGCTGVTILSNDIFSNTGGGIVLGTAFIKRLVGGAEQRGFAANEIFHNALATCGGPQTAAQIVVTGATGLLEGVCPSNTDEGNCVFQNDPSPSNDPNNDNDRFNNQCLWTGSECVVAWDLGPGATDASCNVANRFRDYIRDGNPNANVEGAIFATSGARVLANRNNWPNGSAVQGSDINVSADAGTFIRADLTCGATSLTCREP